MLAGGWNRAVLILGSAQPQWEPPAGTKRLPEEFAGARRCGLAGGSWSFAGLPSALPAPHPPLPAGRRSGAPPGLGARR